MNTRILKGIFNHKWQGTKNGLLFCWSIVTIRFRSDWQMIKVSWYQIACYFDNESKRTYLALSWPRPLWYKNQSIDLLRKSMDWLLYDTGLHNERVKITPKEGWDVADLKHVLTLISLVKSKGVTKISKLFQFIAVFGASIYVNLIGDDNIVKFWSTDDLHIG